jgi:hypothetical protein
MSLVNRFCVALACVLLALAINSNANESNCSDASLNGSYGLHASGNIGQVPYSAVGRFVFDGKGNLHGTLWSRLNQQNVVETLTGTYKVNSFCVVTDSWNLSSGVTTTHISIIVDNGTGYVILNNTSPSPSNVSGEARRQ